MRLSVTVGVATPFKLGPSAWHAIGFLDNGRELAVNGNSLSKSRETLSLKALLSLLKAAKRQGHYVSHIAITIHEKDIIGAFTTPEGPVISCKTQLGDEFNYASRDVRVTWVLLKENDLHCSDTISAPSMELAMPGGAK